jgi:hypothetical protein
MPFGFGFCHFVFIPKMLRNLILADFPGNIPESIGNLTQLVSWAMCHNELTGKTN